MLAGVHREDRENVTPRVTHMELFFDLVLVFAFIQISHLLLEHLTDRGAAQTLVLFAGLWWAWNYTAWATNWVDPDRPPVRGLMVVLMFLALLMAVAAPHAFGDRGMLFAVAYVLLQVFRGAFMAAAFGPRSRMGRNYLHLAAWSAIAGVGWIAGAFADGDLRLLLWGLAVVVDLAAPLHGFALPRLGRTPMRDWDLAGGHLAERFHLVVIIALGESVIEIGLTLTGTPMTTPVVVALVAGFILTVSLWWMYFIRHAEESTRALVAAADPARVGRGGYAYGHAFMVGGIIVVAVAIAHVLHHPTGDVDGPTAALLLVGPALYLGGNAVFNHALSRRVPRSRVLGLGALAVTAPLTLVLTPVAVLVVVAVITVVLALGTGTPRRAVPHR